MTAWPTAVRGQGDRGTQHREEYRTIAQRFPGCQFKRQELHLAEGRHYDVLVIDDPEGLEHRIWFDISRFFGKG